jgi:hypothetical protein
MTDRKQVYIYYNVDRKCIVDSTNTPVSSSFYPVIYYKESPVIFLTLYKGLVSGTATPYTSLSASMSFNMAINDTWNNATALMVKSRNATDVNIAGDWSSADITQGRLSIRVDANTVGFAAEVGTEEWIEASLELQGWLTIDAVPKIVLVLRMPVLCYNLVDASDTSTTGPADPVSSYYNAAYMDTFLADKAELLHGSDNHTDFSFDNVASTGNDFYYRAGRLRVDNVIYDSASGVISCPAGSDYYVEIDNTGTLHSPTTGFTIGRTPLYLVEGNVGSVSATDRRAWLQGAFSHSFIDLDDVTQTYTGASGYDVVVNAGGTGLSFTSRIDHLTELLDTPATYTGASGYTAKVKDDGTALEFVRNDMSATAFSNNDVDSIGYGLIHSLVLASYIPNGGAVIYDAFIIKSTTAKSESLLCCVSPNGGGSYNLSTVLTSTPDIGDYCASAFGDIKACISAANLDLYATPTTDNWEVYGTVRVVEK